MAKLASVTPQTQYSAPNGVVWEYFEIVRLAALRARDVSPEILMRQEVATCIVMSVTAVEVFFNLYFRIVVEEEGSETEKKSLLNYLSTRKGVEFKLKNWPLKILGKRIDPNSEAIINFERLRKFRNSIVHFTSSYETIEIPGSNITFRGMANTSEYFSLKPNDAKDALNTAIAVVSEVFLLRGVKPEDLQPTLLGWCGMPFNNQFNKGLG